MSGLWLHPALWTLLGLRIRGGLRRSLHELRKLHRAAAFLAGVSIIGLAVSSVLGGDAVVARLDPARLGALFQSGLLGFLLVGQIKTLGDKAVYFSPSEVDFLFSGPFTRRELLTYRVLSAAGGIFVLSSLLTILFASVGAWWPAVFVGAALSFLSLHQLAMCLATVRETVEAHAYSLARRIIILSMVTLVIASIVYGVSLQSAELGGNAAFGVLNAAYGTWTMRLLLAPFLPFAEIVSAQGFGPETLGWIAVCVAINAATFAVLVRLDAGNLRTAAVLSSRDVSDARVADSPLRRSRSRRSPLPPLPHLKGAGTIASLQIARAVRGSRLLGELALVVLFIAGGFYLSPAGGGSDGDVSLTRIAYVMIWTTIIVSNPLRFDFRGGVHHLEYLKTLPLPAWAICTGQLFMPILITLAYLTPFFAMASQALDPASLLNMILLAAVLTLIWYTLENLGFLLYPAAQSSRGLGDVQYIGRQLLMLSVKSALLSLAALVAFGVSYAVAQSFALDQRDFVTLLIAVLAIQSIAAIAILSEVFNRFDPSRTLSNES